MQKRLDEKQMLALVGTESEASSWLRITQQRVNEFAAATNDHQFIHVDPEKAVNAGFGGTIAHGFLMLSLLPYLLAEKSFLPKVPAVRINYGSDKVRFLMPVPVGSYVRARQKVLSINEKSPGSWQIKIEATMEIQGEDKPALIAELIALMLAGKE